MDEFDLPFAPVLICLCSVQDFGVDLVVGEIGQVLAAGPVEPVRRALRGQPGNGQQALTPVYTCRGALSSPGTTSGWPICKANAGTVRWHRLGRFACI